MAIAVALLVSGSATPAAHAERRISLPLGHPGLTELRTTRTTGERPIGDAIVVGR
jgi:hypothetical protein